MKALLTKQLFILFNLPILLFIILSFFITKDVINTIGVNREIQWNIWDKYLGNSFYNFSVFIISYPIYSLGYFIVFLMKRMTNYHWSMIHFSMVIFNLVVVCIAPYFYILIPLSIICFIIFIFNIFKTTKKPTTINQQPTTK